MKFQEQERDTKINNWLVAVMLNFSFINGVIGVEGASLITLAVIIFLCILSMRRKEFTIYSSAMVLIAFILVCFLISFCRVKDPSYTFFYLEYFLAFGVLALLVGLQNISIDKVVMCMCRIGLVGILIWISRKGHLLHGFSSDDSPHLMGLSYAILLLLFSSVIGLALDFRTRMISIINIFLVTYILLKVAPRGIWLAIAFFIAIYCFFALSQIKDARYRFVIKIIAISIALLAIFFVINNFTEIILGIADVLSSKFGIKIYALSKYANYLKRGDILNGRGEIWGNAVQYVRDNPLFGKGIGYFEYQGDGGYAHNIFIQVLCEGGLFLLVPIVFAVLRSFGIFLGVSAKFSRSEYLFFALTFTCGVVNLFYSSVHWINIPFWFFLGYFLKITPVNMKNREVGIKL